ncbi:MAG TPA: glutamate--tRNA ligase [Ktedonobacterales bacterium]|nr:glutamate--tRNA ligase [Ktedonobacterales bacterium]
MRPARTRYAPSPTGFPHIGNYRTALFAYLIAKHSGGQFILRIEDTDRKRYVEGATENIMEGLRWLGLNWDEGPEAGGDYGPYFQSERLDVYREHGEKLIETGHAYRCYCTEERLEAMRAEQRARKEPEHYDRRCRNLTPTERAAREAEGLASVVRFAAPLEGTTTYHDALRGDLTFDNTTIDDMVLLKSDGFPTYNFANIVDDHLMDITHVIRGEEYISSAPRYAQVYRAFGWEEPEVIHAGLVLAPDRSKLSKRHGALPLLDYRDKGYLPEAVNNFLVLLGWALDDHTEFFTLDDLVKVFDYKRIGTSPSVFDIARLDWFNGQYIRKMTPDELLDRAMPFLVSTLPAVAHADRTYATEVLALDQERIKTLADVPALTAFFFEDQPEYDPALLLSKNLDAARAIEALTALTPILREQGDWTHDALLATLDAFVVANGFLRKKADGSEVPDRGPVFMLVRVATSGRKETPGLPEMLALLGKERVLTRLDVAREKLQGYAALGPDPHEA